MTSRTTKMVEGLIRVISAARGNPTQKNKTPIDCTVPEYLSKLREDPTADRLLPHRLTMMWMRPYPEIDRIMLSDSAMVTHSYYEADNGDVHYSHWTVNHPIQPNSWEYMLCVICELHEMRTPVQHAHLKEFVEAVGGTLAASTHVDDTVHTATIYMDDQAAHFIFEKLDYYHVPDPLLSAISASPIAEFDIDGLAQALKYAYELGSSEDINACILKLAWQHEIGIVVHQNESNAVHSVHGGTPLMLCYTRTSTGEMLYNGWFPVVYDSDKLTLQSQRDFICVELRRLKVPYGPQDFLEYMRRYFGMLPDSRGFLSQFHHTDNDRPEHMLSGLSHILMGEPFKAEVSGSDWNAASIVVFPHRFSRHGYMRNVNYCLDKTTALADKVRSRLNEVPD